MLDMTYAEAQERVTNLLRGLDPTLFCRGPGPSGREPYAVRQLLWNFKLLSPYVLQTLKARLPNKYEAILLFGCMYAETC